MIPALGAGGLQFNPGFRPFFYVAPLPTFVSIVQRSPSLPATHSFDRATFGAAQFLK